MSTLIFLLEQRPHGIGQNRRENGDGDYRNND